jgi:hypothetical protein
MKYIHCIIFFLLLIMSNSHVVKAVDFSSDQKIEIRSEDKATPLNSTFTQDNKYYFNSTLVSPLSFEGSTVILPESVDERFIDITLDETWEKFSTKREDDHGLYFDNFTSTYFPERSNDNYRFIVQGEAYIWYEQPVSIVLNSSLDEVMFNFSSIEFDFDDNNIAYFQKKLTFDLGFKEFNVNLFIKYSSKQKEDHKDEPASEKSFFLNSTHYSFTFADLQEFSGTNNSARLKEVSVIGFNLAGISLNATLKEFSVKRSIPMLELTIGSEVVELFNDNSVRIKLPQEINEISYPDYLSPEIAVEINIVEENHAEYNVKHFNNTIVLFGNLIGFQAFLLRNKNSVLTSSSSFILNFKLPEMPEIQSNYNYSIVKYNIVFENYSELLSIYFELHLSSDTKESQIELQQLDFHPIEITNTKTIYANSTDFHFIQENSIIILFVGEKAVKGVHLIFIIDNSFNLTLLQIKIKSNPMKVTIKSEYSYDPSKLIEIPFNVRDSITNFELHNVSIIVHHSMFIRIESNTLIFDGSRLSNQTKVNLLFSVEGYTNFTTSITLVSHDLEVLWDIVTEVTESISILKIKIFDFEKYSVRLNFFIPTLNIQNGVIMNDTVLIYFQSEDIDKISVHLHVLDKIFTKSIVVQNGSVIEDLSNDGKNFDYGPIYVSTFLVSVSLLIRLASEKLRNKPEIIKF